MSGETTTTELEIRKMELELRLRQVELPMKLALIGLRGTLLGAIFGGLVILALAWMSATLERIEFTGTHICIMAGMLFTTMALFGAFIFQRSVSIGGAWKGKQVSVGTSDIERPVVKSQVNGGT